jgi:hypothetical protein
MASKYANLYRADTGALLGRVDVGDGLRAKSWLEEIPRLLLEAATARGLTADGYGILANFPAFIDGRKTQSRAVGENLTARALNSVQLFIGVPQTQLMGTGDAAVTAWGDVALNVADPAAVNYANAGPTNPALPPVPRGARSPAFVMSDTGAGNYNLAATDGILSFVVNGATFAITVGAGAATTLAQVMAAIQASGAPVRALLNNTNFVLVTTIGQGRCQNIMAVNTAGTAGAVIFAAQGNVVHFGNGSPLGQMDNSDSLVSGVKSARRILPGSLRIAMTMATEAIVASDARLTGLITGRNIAGTTTVTGTVTYSTGNMEFDTVGDAPDNATAVTATYKALIPVDLSEEVNLPAGASDIAILVS